MNYDQTYERFKIRFHDMFSFEIFEKKIMIIIKYAINEILIVQLILIKRIKSDFVVSTLKTKMTFNYAIDEYDFSIFDLCSID